VGTSTRGRQAEEGREEGRWDNLCEVESREIRMIDDAAAVEEEEGEEEEDVAEGRVVSSETKKSSADSALEGIGDGTKSRIGCSNSNTEWERSIGVVGESREVKGM
jgi:hypothetical protein